jgi:hypothetical protein
LFFFEILIGAKSKDPETISSAMPLRGVRTMLLTEHPICRRPQAERIKTAHYERDNTLALVFIMGLRFFCNPDLRSSA